MIHWFVTEVYPIALRTAVGSVTAFAVATFVTTPLRRAWTRYARHTHSIANALDTSTPGGITDVLNELKHIDTGTPGGLQDVVDRLDKFQSEVSGSGESYDSDPLPAVHRARASYRWTKR